jgi:hypothetical protein
MNAADPSNPQTILAKCDLRQAALVCERAAVRQQKYNDRHRVHSTGR